MKITGNYSNGELELGLSTGSALTRNTYNRIFDKNKVSYKDACGLFNESGYAGNLSYDLLNDDMKDNLRDYVIDHCDAGLSGYSDGPVFFAVRVAEVSRPLPFRFFYCNFATTADRTHSRRILCGPDDSLFPRPVVAV